MDESSFFDFLLGFSPYWDYKNNNKYVGRKTTDLSTVDNNPLKADCIDGSVVNGVKKPILYSFVLNKPPGYQIFCSPETTHYKEIKQNCSG